MVRRAPGESRPAATGALVLAEPTALTAGGRSQPPAAPARVRTRPLGPLMQAVTGRDALDHPPWGRKGSFAWNFGIMVSVPVVLNSWLPLSFPWSMLAAAVMGGTLAPLPHYLQAWHTFRRRQRWIPARQLDGMATGTPVRVRGIVEAVGDAYLDTGSGLTAVFSRTVFSQAGAELREETRGVPFDLRLLGGGTVRLDPATVLLLDPPRRLKRFTPEVQAAVGRARPGLFRDRYLQSRLAPGDAVEAMGYLARDVHPDGAAAPGRGVPLVHSLAPAQDGRVLVRKLRRA
jgi:hypothetical protein